MQVSLLALGGIFLSGLALNLTPCVYPMLSVTVALFGGGEKRSTGRAFFRALLYVFGMAVMYSSLGTAAALTGRLFGAALQAPWMNGLLAGLMFLLALSMFGLYEFSLPPALIGRLGGKRRAGLIGIFISGLVVGIFAAPCIGPPIVALLTVVGQSGNPLVGFLVFFALSLGLGLPYLVLGTFSGLLQKLPRSGEWLVWIKKLFGFVLLGVSFFYFALALYPELVPGVIPVTVSIAAIYLGFVDRAGNTNSVFKIVKRFGAGAALVTVLLSVVSVATYPRDHVRWEPYSIEALERASQTGSPVVIDFFADWCIPCHELERYTFSDPKVIEELQSFVRLRADVTNPNTEKLLEPIERFDVPGVPTIVFLNGKGEEVREARISGYVPPPDFLESVEIVKKKGQI